MDDNIHMQQCSPAECSDECSSHASLRVNGSDDACGQADRVSTINGVNDPCDRKDAVVTVNSTLHACNGVANLRWHPSHILDFSDLSIGLSLFVIIPQCYFILIAWTIRNRKCD